MGGPGRNEKGYLSWGKTEMGLRAVQALCWPVSDQRSAWETYGDSRIWCQTGVE